MLLGSVDIGSKRGVQCAHFCAHAHSKSVAIQAQNGLPSAPYYDPNQPNSAQYVYDITLHELGHAYGLNDTPVPVDPGTGQASFALQPAGASIMNGSVNTNDQGPHLDASGQPVQGGIGAKSVQSCDKQQISQSNPPPSGSGQPPSCVPNCSGGQLATCTSSMGTDCSGCQPPYCSPPYSWYPHLCVCFLYPSNPSPIVIDTDGSGFHLTSAADGVLFDFFGNGAPIQISWTAKASANGWLALDRNGNGVIDSAKELFGNITAQPTSGDPNGFLALAVFDEPENGGNGDGVIDSRDDVWAKLLVLSCNI